MSYDISIIDKKTRKTIDITDSCFEDIDIDGFQDYGGTYMLGQKTELSTNITYNYHPFFTKVFGSDGIRSLYGMKFKDAEDKLNSAIKTLESADPSSKEWTHEYPKKSDEEKETYYRLLGIRYEEPQGYWRCTVENVLKALVQLKFLMDTAKKLNPEHYNEDFEIAGD